MKRIATAAVALVLLASPAAAQDRAGQFEIGGGAGLYRFDHDRGRENDNLFSFGGGYYFTNAWAAELTFVDTGRDLGDTSLDFDSSQYRLDGLYHFGSLSRWLPYVAAGVGSLKTVEAAAGSDTAETQLNFGGGVKFMLSDSLTLRGDLRALRGEAGDQDLAAMFGLSVRLGGQPRNGLAQGRDSDGDGVPDAHDQCDWTPVAASVDSLGCSQAQAAEGERWRLGP